MKILVLGMGNVGKEIARTLNMNHDVTVIEMSKVLDISFSRFIPGDIRDINFLNHHMEEFKSHDMIINALPGSISYEVLELLIPLGIDIVDVSFMPQDPRKLDYKAKIYNTRVIYDCGVAPGLSNILLGYHNKGHNIKNYTCIVGGMPAERTAPYYHKTLFSLKDLLSEYLRPARYKKGHQIRTVNPLDHIYNQYYPGIGTLESFPSDGLRSLLDLNIPDMYELTLRYPGHLQTMRFLKDGGFLEPEHLHNTIQVLEKEWQTNINDNDLFLMDIVIETDNNKIFYSIFDEAQIIDDHVITAMARVTAYSCIAVVEALSKMSIKECHYGVIEPEEFAMRLSDKEFTKIIDSIKSHGISIQMKELNIET